MDQYMKLVSADINIKNESVSEISLCKQEPVVKSIKEYSGTYVSAMKSPTLDSPLHTQ